QNHRYMCEKEMKAMTTQDVIQSFYRSISNKDDKWKELWSGDAVFSDASQTLLAKGKEAVIQSFTPFIKGVVGLKVSEIIVEGEKACFIMSYTYVNSEKERLNKNVDKNWKVRDGK